MTDTREVDGTIKFDAGKRRYDLLPLESLEEVVKALEYGASKYGAYNWRLGTSWSRYYTSTVRHLFAWWRGEDNDSESGLHHLAHVGATVLFLLYYVRQRTSFDDRLTTQQPKPEGAREG